MGRINNWFYCLMAFDSVVYTAMIAVAIFFWVKRRESEMMKRIILARWFHPTCLLSAIVHLAYFISMTCIMDKENFPDTQQQFNYIALVLLKWLAQMVSSICFFSVLAYWVGFYIAFREVRSMKPKVPGELQYPGNECKQMEVEQGLIQGTPKKESCLGATRNDKARNLVLLVAVALLMIWLTYTGVGYTVVILMYRSLISSDSSSSEGSYVVILLTDMNTAYFILCFFFELGLTFAFGYYIIRFTVFFHHMFRGQSSPRKTILRKMLIRILIIPIILFIVFLLKPFSRWRIEISPYSDIEKTIISAICYLFLDVLPITLSLFFFHRLSVAKLGGRNIQGPGQQPKKSKQQRSSRNSMSELDYDDPFDEAIIEQSDDGERAPSF